MKKLGISLGCALMLFGMTGCAGGFSSTPPDEPDVQVEETATPNTDPREGWVIVQEHTGNASSEGDIRKKCDGTTLLYILYGYHVEGFTASANNPECQPEPQ